MMHAKTCGRRAGLKAYVCVRGHVQAGCVRWTTPDAITNIEAAVGENDHKACLHRSMFVAEVL